MDKQKLQACVDNIVVGQNPDGTWKLDNTKADKLLKMIKGYIWKAAYISDRFDPEDAYAEVLCQVWVALKRYGPRYQDKPFYNLFKMKVNNVLTDRHKKRESLKSRLNFCSESYERLLWEDAEGKLHGKVPYYNPIDLCSIEEALSPKQYNALEMACTEMEATVPQKIGVDAILELVSRLEDEEAEDLQVALFSKKNKVDRNTARKAFIALSYLITPATAPKDSDEDNEYNDTTPRLRVHCDDDTFEDDDEEDSMSDGKLVEIGTGEVGNQFLTPYDKRIEIIKKQGNKVKILIHATDKEIEVPASYLVHPYIEEIEVTPDEPEATEEEAGTEEAATEEPEEVEEPEEEDDDEEDDDEEDDDEEDDDDEDEEEDEEEEEEEEDDDDEDDDDEGNDDSAEDDSTGDDDPEEEDSEDPETEEEDATQEPATDSNDKGKKMYANTAIELVTKLLTEGPRTREELAKAIIEQGLTKNKSLDKVKSYVSVILHKIKKKNDDFQNVKRGVYVIASK